MKRLICDWNQACVIESMETKANKLSFKKTLHVHNYGPRTG